MRLYGLWATVLPHVALYLAAVTQAQTQSLPQCSVKCLSELIPQSTCAATNQTCICTNADLKEKLNLCVEENCTVKETFATLNITKTECGDPIRNETAPSIWIPAVGFVVLLFIPLRLYTRVVITKLGLGWDDWTTVLLGCVMIPFNIDSILVGIAGLGRDIWTLQYHAINRILYILYIQELLYITCLTLTKVSFVLFYLRIFPSDRIRLIIKASGVVTICYGIAFIFALAFQCSPVSFNWTSWDGEHNGKCVKKNPLVVAAGIINIILDAWVIALPIPRLLNLQASFMMKLQVVLMFSVGFLITGVSIYRVVMLKLFATSTNPTWDNAAGGYWSIIEVDVGVLCLCMPSMRSLLSHMLPSVFGSAKADSSMGQLSTQKKSRVPPGGPTNASFTRLIELDVRGSIKSHVEDC